MYALEVADKASRKVFVHILENRPVDLLIRNAGVYGSSQAPLGTTPEDKWKEVLLTLQALAVLSIGSEKNYPGSAEGSLHLIHFRNLPLMLGFY